MGEHCVKETVNRDCSPVDRDDRTHSLSLDVLEKSIILYQGIIKTTTEFSALGMRQLHALFPI